MYEYEIYKDDADEWRWRLVAGNGQIVADSGEGYATKTGAALAIDRFREEAVVAGIKKPDPDGPEEDGP